MQVNNHTTQHLLLPDVLHYVPPQTSGRIVPLPSLQRLRASFAPPPLVVDPLPTPGQVAVLTYFAEDLSPHPGVSDVATAAPEMVLGNAPAGGGTATVSVPTGLVQAIGYLVTGVIPTTIVLTGVQSGLQYFNGAPSARLAAFPFAVLDTQVVISTVGGNAPVYVLAWLTTPANFVENVPGTNLNVSLAAAVTGVAIDTKRAPYDWQALNDPGVNVRAVATMSTVGGNAQQELDMIVATLFTTAATAAARLNVWDGPDGTGTKIWTRVMSVPAQAGAVDKVELVGLGLRNTRSNASTLAVSFDAAGGAGVSEVISIGGYTR